MTGDAVSAPIALPVYVEPTDGGPAVLETATVPVERLNLWRLGRLLRFGLAATAVVACAAVKRQLNV